MRNPSKRSSKPCASPPPSWPRSRPTRPERSACRVHDAAVGRGREETPTGTRQRRGSRLEVGVRDRQPEDAPRACPDALGVERVDRPRPDDHPVATGGLRGPQDQTEVAGVGYPVEQQDRAAVPESLREAEHARPEDREHPLRALGVRGALEHLAGDGEALPVPGGLAGLETRREVLEVCPAPGALAQKDLDEIDFGEQRLAQQVEALGGGEAGLAPHPRIAQAAIALQGRVAHAGDRLHGFFRENSASPPDGQTAQKGPGARRPMKGRLRRARARRRSLEEGTRRWVLFSCLPEI